MQLSTYLSSSRCRIRTRTDNQVHQHFSWHAIDYCQQRVYSIILHVPRRNSCIVCNAAPTRTRDMAMHAALVHVQGIHKHTLSSLMKLIKSVEFILTVNQFQSNLNCVLRQRRPAQNRNWRHSHAQRIRAAVLYRTRDKNADIPTIVTVIRVSSKMNVNIALLYAQPYIRRSFHLETTLFATLLRRSPRCAWLSLA